MLFHDMLWLLPCRFRYLLLPKRVSPIQSILWHLLACRLSHNIFLTGQGLLLSPFLWRRAFPALCILDRFSACTPLHRVILSRHTLFHSLPHLPAEEQVPYTLFHFVGHKPVENFFSPSRYCRHCTFDPDRAIPA